MICYSNVYYFCVSVNLCFGDCVQCNSLEFVLRVKENGVRVE